MDEIDKNKKEEVKRIVGFDDLGEHEKKPVSIVKDKKQLSIRIPKKFVELLGINEKKDYFEFHLIVDNNGKTQLEGILIRE